MAYIGLMPLTKRHFFGMITFVTSVHIVAAFMSVLQDLLFQRRYSGLERTGNATPRAAHGRDTPWWVHKATKCLLLGISGSEIPTESLYELTDDRLPERRFPRRSRRRGIIEGCAYRNSRTDSCACRGSISRFLVYLLKSANG